MVVRRPQTREKIIQFETMAFCNAKCHFCPVPIKANGEDEFTRPRGIMKDETFYKIIKDGKAMGVRKYYPYLNGEPFLFPRIYQYLDYMEKEGVLVGIYTNGALMDVDKVLKYKNIYRLNVSINAASPETHKKVMGLSSYDKVVANAKKLAENYKGELTFGFVVSPESAHEKRIFLNMWGKHANLVPYANWSGGRPEPEGWEKTKVRRHCRRVSTKITILWDGRLNLCCMDYDGKVIWGDINKENLADIEAKKEALIKRHAVNDYSNVPCNTCNYNTM